jgi:hypothetical protein
MERSVRRRVLVVSLVVIAACGDDGKQAFSPAAIGIDQNKMMAELTTAERATMCDELSRSLTASFGSKDVMCAFGSHSGPREGTSTCQDWYDQCERDTSPTTPINGCTEKMADMWSCPITAGQYEACFNAANSQLLKLVVDTPVCQTPPKTEDTDACRTAPCDYLWFD